mgnify:CR=1 FL=1
MERSESIVELAKALSKFQGAITSVPKKRENPFFHSKYADLDAVWEMCRKPLAENGLAVVQTTTEDEHGGVYLETTLLHISGDWMQTQLAINALKNDPQAVGSAITYARRYAMSALLGISAEDDDDAEQSMARDEKPGQAPAKPPVAQPAPGEIRRCPNPECNGAVLRLNTFGKWSHSTGRKRQDGKDEWHNFTKAQLQHPAHPAEAPPVDATDDGNGTTDFEQSMASEPAPVSHSAEVPGFASVGELMAQVNKTYRLTQTTIFDILGLEYLGQLREKYSNLSDAWAKIVKSQEEEGE